eukprot:gene9-15_t
MYAYKGRPWELKSITGLDIFDPLLSSVNIQLKGIEFMRVLPKVDDTLNEEWITDKEYSKELGVTAVVGATVVGSGFGIKSFVESFELQNFKVQEELKYYNGEGVIIPWRDKVMLASGLKSPVACEAFLNVELGFDKDIKSTQLVEKDFHDFGERVRRLSISTELSPLELSELIDKGALVEKGWMGLRTKEKEAEISFKSALSTFRTYHLQNRNTSMALTSKEVADLNSLVQLSERSGKRLELEQEQGGH